MSHDTQLTCSYSKWVSYQNSNVVVDPNTWELKIFVLYEERRDGRGEKRRERSMWMRIVLGDLHPHPPKKLFHVLVVIALIVEQAWKKKRSGMERKKRNKFPTHAKVSNLLCVWYGWYRDVRIRMVLWTGTALQQQVYAPFMHILGLLGLMYIPYKIFPSCRQQLLVWVPLLRNHMKETKCIESCNGGKERMFCTLCSTLVLFVLFAMCMTIWQAMSLAIISAVSSGYQLGIC